MRASIVIAAHNEGEALWKTIRSCVETCSGLDYEIVVADDASTDDSVAEALGRFPRIRVVRQEQRQGAAPAKDFGARQSGGAVLVFLDGHCNPEPGAIVRLVEDVEQVGASAIVTPRIPALDVAQWRNIPSQTGDGYFLDLEKLDCGWLQLSELRGVNVGRRRFYESPALIGCALAVSRVLYDDLQGFDPHMRIWGVEDLDFGLKCWLMGHRILHDPDAVVGHRFRAKFDNYDVPMEHFVVNQLRMAWKNFTRGVWSDWVDRARQRHAGRLVDHPEGLWAHVWDLFTAGRASADQERAYLHAKRPRDEFWYAERFGLTYPRLHSAPLVAVPGWFQARLMAGPSPSPSPSPPPAEWKAWPGGQEDRSLNLPEAFISEDFGFTGNVDWDVGGGWSGAIILETNSTTATNRASITVRYDSASGSSGEDDTVWVQATQGGVTKTKKRTVFYVSWSLKFQGAVENTDLFFPATSGGNRRVCAFNWPPDDNATRVSAKMEAVLGFTPQGIAWSARGVTFKYGVDGGFPKFGLRLERKRRASDVNQPVGAANRSIETNEDDWFNEPLSHPGDCQHPTDARPDKAFRIDAPSFDPTGFVQEAMRGDLREIAQWCDGGGWKQISYASQGEWQANLTSVLPNGAKGGTNSHGAGVPATNVPNTQPVANAGPNQTVSSGAHVILNGSGSSDADNDTLTYKWTQTAGPQVTLSSTTSRSPDFTAPTGPATLTFELKVKDITQDLLSHNPGNAESQPSTVTITVQAP